MKKLVFPFVFLTLFACGKTTKVTNKVNSNLNRYIDAQTEGNFTAQEAALGNAFCLALSYKKSNFVSMYASGNFVKKFVFEMEQKSCGNELSATFNQTLKYSNNNGISYAADGAPGVVPTVDTDTFGFFATYCGNRNQNSRVYNSGGETKVFHFFPGSDCGGEASQICAVFEKALNTDLITTNYKRVVISNGAFLNRDLKGQELFSEEQASCNGSIQMLKYTLRTILDN